MEGLSIHVALLPFVQSRRFLCLWGFGSKPGFFYRGSNGNSGFSGGYNTRTATFTAGSTYYDYKTENVLYQSQNKYFKNGSLSHVLVGHYYTTFSAAWRANANTIRIDLTSTRHDVYADYSFGLSNNGEKSVIDGNSSVDHSGLGLALVGVGLEAGSVKMFNEKNWYSLKQMKTYSQSFNGSGYTGGKNASAGRISTAFKWAGRLLGASNAYSVNDQYISGDISDSQMVLEQSSNIYSTFGGLYGAAWGIGWELGRAITSLDSYQKFRQNTLMPWRKENLGY